MKVLILGGGPAGLYSGLLLKKANPAHDVKVLERNPPDATYGWGIVFSDRTLNSLREADYKSYKDITDHFVLWDAIDVRYRGQIVRSGGHVFAGMARKKLLNILQRRCCEVGVQLEFGREATDLSQLEPHDLLIAADGINSIVRTAYANVFQPKQEVGKAKFVWLGTDRVFDSFTYIFAENEHGLFQVHSYPFDGSTSTFIVECAEEAWRAAGLDQAGEADTIAYCERLFADSLEGCSLLPNRSNWINFVTVRNKVWRHGNAVLLGDSAHTAHFTIGSGTKLAMEDAIALVNAFEQHHEIELALTEYELARRPAVEALQKSADESRTYFENTRRYLDFQPMQFAFQLMTRSGKITYDDLRVRDSSYMDSMDRWFWKAIVQHSECAAPALLAPPPMFTPVQFRGITLANRAVLAAAKDCAAVDGMPQELQSGELVRQACGGAGLVLTELAAVSPEARITPECAGIYLPEHGEAWKKIVDAIHADSPAKIAIQLGHAGRRGSTRPRREGLDRPLPESRWTACGWPLISASAIPYTSESQVPKEADKTDMAKVLRDLVQAAKAACHAGFDMLQLHFAHGYLFGSFVSPLTNQRTDSYGGSLEIRIRFPLEVVDAVRAAWPEDRPLAVAISATDCVKGGFETDDAVIFARNLQAHGCDLIAILAGQTTPGSVPNYGYGFLTALSDRIRNEAGVPTMVAGYLTTTEQVNTIVAAGRADLCIMDVEPQPSDLAPQAGQRHLNQRQLDVSMVRDH